MGLPMITLLIFFAVGLTVAAVLLLIQDLLLRPRRDLDRRLGLDSDDPHIHLSLETEEPPADTLSGKIDREYYRLIAGTGMDLNPWVAVLTQVACGLAVGAATFVWYDDSLPALVGLVLGTITPVLFFAYRRSRRLRAMQNQLPDVLELLARGVRAGESLDQAIALVGRESPEPLGAEFRQCAKQLDMGLSLPAAVRSLCRRVPLVEMRILLTTLLVHRQAGGHLPLTLERLAGVARDRLSYRRQFRALTAGARFSTALIVTVSLFVLCYMFTWQPEYIRNFFEQPAGWTMLATAAGLQIIGLAWITSMLRIEY